MTSPKTSTRTDEAEAKAPDSTGEEHGPKHKLDDGEISSLDAKRSKKSHKMEQKTIEETINGPSSDGKPRNGGDDESKDTDEEDGKNDVSPDAQSGSTGQNGQSAEESHGRNGSTPANVLEKGIIYFFFRGRVNTDHPEGVSDIARSYLILRPIHQDAKLGSGPIGDAGTTRLLALPKKVLPLSGRDRWIVFVEKVGVSFAELKDEFLAGNDYVTKTVGTRHTPEATPAGEGIYAITSTGRESHLAYMMTLPKKIGEVQEELGLRERGSFILSTRNPKFDAPRNTQLPDGPDFTDEVQGEFGSLRWLPTQPKHLDFVNAQVLLVGEPGGLDKATEPQKESQKADVDDPIDEMDKLEEEDAERMQHLAGNDSERIFADLEARAKDYPALQTTF